MLDVPEPRLRMPRPLVAPVDTPEVESQPVEETPAAVSEQAEEPVEAPQEKTETLESAQELPTETDAAEEAKAATPSPTRPIPKRKESAEGEEAEEVGFAEQDTPFYIGGPPPAAAPKKSKTPMMLGAVAVLALIFVGAVTAGILARNSRTPTQAVADATTTAATSAAAETLSQEQPVAVELPEEDPELALTDADAMKDTGADADEEGKEGEEGDAATDDEAAEDDADAEDEGSGPAVATASPWQDEKSSSSKSSRSESTSSSSKSSSDSKSRSGSSGSGSSKSSTSRSTQTQSRTQSSRTNSNTKPARAVTVTADAAGGDPWGTSPGPSKTGAVSSGKVAISTAPTNAKVFVDGRSIGRSPITTDLDYGMHTVRVEMAGYKSDARAVDVQVADMSVPFELRPVVVSGDVNIFGATGSRVFVDDNPVGNLPTTARLSEGKHSFRVVTEDGSSFTLSREVRFDVPGRAVTVVLSEP